MYSKKGKLRTDNTVQGMETRSYMINEEFTSCSKSDGDWTCNKLSLQEEDEADEMQDLVKEKPEDFKVTKVSGRTIAKTKTECYKITSDEDAELEYCFSKEGVPLYVNMESKGMSSEQKATSYSLSVSNTDFNIPATAKEIVIPDLPEGIPDDILAKLPG